ncbi:Required for respiratory growth protein 9, mitochondrial [Trichoplax sp. H2]|nr:Required for respiratory growth protein 9, mitochondrial [Trichoplax sp. H2]|eukprot:RDD40668.1 Required for respiratory growth protein 9, mitochondrial [Trichoplax sp. H2]
MILFREKADINWRAKKQALKDKKTEWKPKKRLAREEMDQIRMLADDNPGYWTKEMLSSTFKISYAAVSRILKSRFEPDAEIKRRQNSIAMKLKANRQMKWQQKHSITNGFNDDKYENYEDEYALVAPWQHQLVEFHHKKRFRDNKIDRSLFNSSHLTGLSDRTKINPYVNLRDKFANGVRDTENSDSDKYSISKRISKDDTKKSLSTRGRTKHDIRVNSDLHSINSNQYRKSIANPNQIQNPSLKNVDLMKEKNPKFSKTKGSDNKHSNEKDIGKTSSAKFQARSKNLNVQRKERGGKQKEKSVDGKGEVSLNEEELKHLLALFRPTNKS